MLGVFSVIFVESNLFSSLLTSLVTFLVGLLAFAVYKKQQSDKKKDAASILLLEIKNAEAQLTQAKEMFYKDTVIPETIFAMKAASWRKYNYLFVRDLTAEEWDLINSFYEKCEEFDEIVQHNRLCIKSNGGQIGSNLYQTMAEFTKEHLKDINRSLPQLSEELQDKGALYKEMVESFFQTYVNATNPYSFFVPRKITIDYGYILETVRLDLSTGTVGIKLERIINQNWRTKLFDWLAHGGH